MTKYLILSSILAFFVMDATASAATDHSLYYKGTLRQTDLSGNASLPSDHTIALKKDILPTQGKFVETVTLKSYNRIKGIWEYQDLTTTVVVVGNNVSAQSADGSAFGSGTIEGIGPDGDFTYLNINFVIPAIKVTVKNINYITPTKLIARKEIDDPMGVPTSLWESDMELISASEYQALYQTLHAGK